MQQKIKKIAETVIDTNAWHEYKHDVFEYPDGTEGNYFYIQTHGGVMVVPVLPDGRLVLVNQYRYLAGRHSSEFPGGGIKNGATIIQAATLELKEETGYDADEIIHVGEFEPSKGLIKDRMHIFIAYVGEAGTKKPDTTEDIEIMARYPDEVEDMVRRNDIWDGETLAAWSLVRHQFIK
jgi:ADP-ribose pyrophosphatase